jgi:hypothetical protein
MARPSARDRSDAGIDALEFNDEAKLALAMPICRRRWPGWTIPSSPGAPRRWSACRSSRPCATPPGIKDHALANLDFYLERFADNVEAGGGKVHWCGDADAARAAVLASAGASAPAR